MSATGHVLGDGVAVLELLQADLQWTVVHKLAFWLLLYLAWCGHIRGAYEKDAFCSREVLC